jgi:LysM repeat protein
VALVERAEHLAQRAGAAVAQRELVRRRQRDEVVAIRAERGERLLLEREVSVTDESAPIPLVHTVEEGENLTYLAETFGTTVEELLAVNNLSEDALLFVGQQLIIPGGEGDAVATLYTAEVGDTLAAVAATFNTTVTEILNSNHLINNEYPLMPGQTLSVVSRTGSALPQTVTGTPYLVQPGESLMMIAARHNLAPARLAALNELPFPTYLFPGQRLRLPSEDSYRFLPGEWVDVQIHPATIIPGATVSIYVENLLDGRPSGQFAGQSLQFTPFAPRCSQWIP